MSKFQIWRSGYLDMGMDGIPAKAELLSEQEAESFEEAVQQFLKEKKDFKSYYRYDNGLHRVWACTLHANEPDARGSYG